jgi:hypothetical protein
MSDDLETGFVLELLLDVDTKIDRGIHHPITAGTSDMVMVFRGTVEASQAAAQLKLLNITAFRKDFKIAIHGSKTDAWKAFANHFVNLISAGMRIYLAKFFQYDSTLSCHPEV